jgi:hypothetical protein
MLIDEYSFFRFPEIERALVEQNPARARPSEPNRDTLTQFIGLLVLR